MERWPRLNGKRNEQRVPNERIPLMTTFATTLEAREEIAEGTTAFHFRKPGGFEFKPGQAIDVILTSNASAPEDQSTRHTFSITRSSWKGALTIEKVWRVL